MDFSPNSDQVAILAAVSTILSRHAGASRLRQLGGDEPAYDHVLDKHLTEAGFLDLCQPGQADRLDAALVVEAIAAGLGNASSAVRALVLPSVRLDDQGPIAITIEGHSGPARFAADAAAVVLVGADEVRCVRPSPGSVLRLHSRLGWPVGDVRNVGRGERLAGAEASDVRTWWRVALAAELVGTMAYALDLTVGHVTDRKQFGRAIGSFQAVQHGLAECAVAVEGARWLTREAAWRGSSETAMAALTQAVRASERVFRDTHQYSGALGFTREYDLHLATMRLPALRAEAGGLGRPATTLARTRWALT